MYRIGFFLFATLMFSASAFAQPPDRSTILDRKTVLGGSGGGSYIIFGDLLVDENKSADSKAHVYEVVLNNIGGLTAGRQYVSAGGRYQFINLAAGQYELV